MRYKIIHSLISTAEPLETRTIDIVPPISKLDNRYEMTMFNRTINVFFFLFVFAFLYMNGGL